MHEVHPRTGLGSATAPDDAPRDDGTLAEGLLDQLLAGVVPEPPGPLDAVARALEAHREHARAWYGDLIGPALVPAAVAVQFVDALRSSDHALPVVILGPWAGRTGGARSRGGDHPFAGDYPSQAAVDGAEALLRAARAQLLDDDRVELAGVEVSLPPALAPAEAAEAALDRLDAAATAWLRIPPDPDWIEALDVIAEDGAERVALILPSPGDDQHQQFAAMIQSLASRRITFCLSSSPGAPGIDLVTTGTAYGLLNLLCAADGAAQAAAASDSAAIGDHAARLTRLADLLAETDAEAIIDQARRISPESAAAIRRRLDRITCGSVRALISDLEAAGLIVPDVA